MKRQFPVAGRFASLLGILVLAAVAACSSGGSDDSGSGAGGAGQASTSAGIAGSPTAAGQASANPFAPVIASSELIVGQNRFALGILDNATRRPLPDAQVHFRFFTLVGNQGTLRSEADARFVAPARDADIPQVQQHRHPDGSLHPHANVAADVGVYVARVQFDQPGQWGVETTFRAKDGREGKINAAFEVLGLPVTPAVGSEAPRTRNPTASSVQDLGQISSGIDPDPALYQTTVADAIAAGKPALVGFITPGFCESQFCGPVYEVVRKLLPKYGDKAAIIHIEPFKEPANHVLSDSATEWRLKSEPIIFIVDRTGKIAAKFEGPVGLAELEEALARVTG